MSGRLVRRIKREIIPKHTTARGAREIARASHDARAASSPSSASGSRRRARPARKGRRRLSRSAFRVGGGAAVGLFPVHTVAKVDLQVVLDSRARQ